MRVNNDDVKAQLANALARIAAEGRNKEQKGLILVHSGVHNSKCSHCKKCDLQAEEA